MKIFKNFAILLLFLIQKVFAEPQWYAAKDGTRFLIEKDLQYNWFQAAYECARRDARLVVVDSEEKKDQIKQVLKVALIANQNLWLSGKRRYNLPPISWSGIEQEFACLYWAECQADNSLHKEQCINIIQYYFKSNEWNDNSCRNTEKGYICEERLAKDNQMKLEYLTNENESVKAMKIAPANWRKWKDIVKSSMRKTKLKNIESLFKSNKTAFKEP